MAIDRIAQLAVDIIVNTRRARNQLNQFHTSLNKNTKATKGLGTGLGRLALAAGSVLVLMRVFRLVTEAITSTVNAYVKLEKQIVNVQKIAKVPIKELTGEFLKLGKTIGGVGFQELSDTMSAAARLGIRGSEGLSEFTKTAVILSQVSGDISSTQAAEGLGRLVKNFNLSTKEANNLASSIDALSDAFPTTSGQILTFSARLAGLAQASNIAAHELNAFGAFMLSTGLSSTVSRTAFVKFFNVLTAKPIEAAKALKLTKDEMDDLINFSVNDPIRAFELFATKLSQLSRPEQVRVLEEISSGSSRLQQAIFNAAGSIEKLNEALGVSEDAFNKGTQLIDKHAIVAGTAAAQIADLGKQWEAFLTSISSAPALLNFASGALARLSKAFGGDIDFKQNPLPDTEKDLKKRDMDNRLKIADKNIERHTLEAKVFKFSSTLDTAKILVIEGEIKKINDDQLRIQEKLALKREAKLKAAKEEEKVEEEIVDNLTRELEQRAVLGRQQEEQFRKDFITPQLNKNPINRISTVIKQISDEMKFYVGDSKSLRNEIKESIESRRTEIREIKAGKLGPFLGKFGSVISSINSLNQAKDTGILNAGGLRDLGMLFNRQIEDMFNKEKSPDRFTGLTEAWKKAQISVNKKDDLTKQQLNIAQQMLDFERKHTPETKTILQNIQRAIETGNPLQLR